MFAPSLGFTGSITRASGNSVTLKQVFKYPVAIGYNGITMPVQSFIKMKINIIPYQENTLNTETNRVGTNVATTKIKVTTDWTELLKNNITSPNLITTPLNQVRYGSEEGLGILEK
ncbi:hypothetical protein JNS45_27145 [Klebsiella pneumoniae]|nr:hypothetical protein [Klebsiella pneumoniae]